MILLWPILAGFLTGFFRAKFQGRSYPPLSIHKGWLLVGGILPQVLAFQVPFLRDSIPGWLAAAALVSSQGLLLLFVIYNLHLPGFRIIGAGLALNLFVILLNGGLMPVSPETLSELYQSTTPSSWPLGARVLGSKDIILNQASTRLWPLSDWILLPAWFPGRAALSAGDMFIAFGAFWCLWSHGEIKENPLEADNSSEVQPELKGKSI